MDFNFKEKYYIDDLLQILMILRGKSGCPWDREQTHESIRRNFIEEVYEAVEAIDIGDKELLKEELGDVLMQVAFHSQIESEEGSFNFSDVTDGVCKKLILRHPHVFSNVDVKDTEEVLKNWDQIKMQTKKQKKHSEVLKSICKALPSLMRCDKIQKRAKKSGYYMDDIKTSLDKIKCQSASLKDKLKNHRPEEDYSMQIGELLFSVVSISGELNVDSEQALSDYCEGFINEFEKDENSK